MSDFSLIYAPSAGTRYAAARPFVLSVGPTQKLRLTAQQAENLAGDIRSAQQHALDDPRNQQHGIVGGP